MHLWLRCNYTGVVGSSPDPRGLQVQGSDQCSLWCFAHSTAKEVEAIVRTEGATPATVGVIDGQVRVGLTWEELDHLAQSRTSVKVSRRDLPYVLSKVRHTLTRSKPKTSYFHRSCHAGLKHCAVIPSVFPGVRPCRPP